MPKRKSPTFLSYAQKKEIFLIGNVAGETQVTLGKKYNVGFEQIGRIHRERRDYELGLIPLPPYMAVGVPTLPVHPV
jgi:hypothetical protein